MQAILCWISHCGRGCTDGQYERGKTDLIRRIARAYDRSDGITEMVHNDTNAEKSQWSSSDDSDDDVAVVLPSLCKATDELTLYLSFMKSKYQPTMKPIKALGAYDDEGHLRKDPILCIGPVLERGKDLPSGKNLADYIDKKGYFNLVKYAQDHSQKAKKGSAAPPFVGTANVILGQLSPHITTEVDCESLFSQAGHAAQPNRNRTTAETFERQVMAKHRLARIYCDPVAVKKEFMERHKKGKWNAKEDRDDLAFWESQKREYLQQNPNHRGMFEELETSADAAEVEEDNGAVELI
mmetsp:Transcript_32462/g.58682  ORF Transcript_32462/g.58682 Transcript_32462/m.58682 type:complete len:296 (+) Transcript_32462:133-1020(+)